MKIPKSLLLFPLLALVATGGCCSIIARCDPELYPAVYPGLRHLPVEYGWGEPIQDEDRYVAVGESGSWDREGIFRLVGFFELPFTFAFDTVLLPWDLPYSLLQKSSHMRADRNTAVR